MLDEKMYCIIVEMAGNGWKLNDYMVQQQRAIRKYTH